MSSDEEREAMGFAADYNDCITQGVDSCKRGAVQMSLFYMCAMHDQVSYDPADKCGLYMPGKLWDRKGCEPISTKVWHCGIERCEWEKEVQKHFLPEAGGANIASSSYDLERAMNSAPGKVGCGCRFRPYQVGSSMVLEVIDRSVNDVITMYAIKRRSPQDPSAMRSGRCRKGGSVQDEGRTPRASTAASQ